MIGGQDIVIPCSDPKVALQVATRAVMGRWRNCLIENGDTGEVLAHFGQMEFAALNEILISKTARASEQWDELGACDETRGTLIHLLASRTTLTVVIDDEPTEEMTRIVGNIRGALYEVMYGGLTIQEAA